MSDIVFEYRAVDASGTTRRGSARAVDQDAAYRQIIALGLTPVTITRAAPGFKRRDRRVRAGDIAQVTQQLGVLVEARIPIGDALIGIAEQEPNERLFRVLKDIAARVQSGQSIAASMSQHRGVFGDVYIECVRAAEKTGNLIKVLALLAEMLERQQETQRQVRSALAYPMIVMATLGLATAFLVVFAVPRFATMFAAKGIELPILTRGLMTVGASVQAYWWAYLGGAVMASMTWRRLWRNAVFQERLEVLWHRIPYLGSILRGLGVARFMRVLSLGLSSGTGLIDSIELASRASGRAGLRADGTHLLEQVRRGGRLADALPGCSYLPLLSKRMLIAGEHSGELPTMCDTVARQYEKDSSALTKNIGSFIEPVLVVLIASVVLVIALSIFLPMWDMVKLMG